MGPVRDVAIVGGGATGLTLALALRVLSRGALSVALVDRGDPALRSGPRTSALAEGPRRMLARLGVWNALAAVAQPISRMEISDARLADAVKAHVLSFEADQPGDPIAHMLFHRDLEPALLSGARDAGVEVLNHSIDRLEAGSSSASILTQSGERIRSRLVVGADGLRSRIRTAARIPVVAWPYERTALVFTIRHEEDHHGVAVQHFLEGGPFASLPVCGRRSSIVWTERTSVADAYRRQTRETLSVEIERRLGGCFGAIEIEEGPESFPLLLQIARRFIGPRLALVGDAAHRVHPLAGQGLNIGMRDVAELADLVLEQMRLGLDPGSEDLLLGYEKKRRFDAISSAAAFDFIHRGYAIPGAPARAVRRFGMAATDRLGGLKAMLRNEASGRAGAYPKLFR